MKAVFDAMTRMAERLNANPKAGYLMGGFTRDVAFTDEEGRERFLVRILEGTMEVFWDREAEDGIIVRVADASRLLPVIQSGLDISHPIAEGAISVIRGKVSDLVLFNRILAVS